MKISDNEMKDAKDASFTPNVEVQDVEAAKKLDDFEQKWISKLMSFRWSKKDLYTKPKEAAAFSSTLQTSPEEKAEGEGEAATTTTTPAAPPTIASPAKTCLKFTLIGLGCLIILSIFGGIIASLHDEILNALYWCKDHTPLSALLYGSLVILGTILGLPVMFLEIGCGFIFGFGGAILTLTIAKPIGAAACYLLGKQCFQGFAKRLITSSPKTKALFTAIERQPWKLLFLLRVALMPGIVKNYGISMINCPFHIFFISCLIGDLPYTLLWSYLGSRGQDLTAVMAGNVEKTPAQSALSLLGLVFLVILFVTMKRSVDKVMEETMRDEEREHREFDDEV